MKNFVLIFSLLPVILFCQDNYLHELSETKDLWHTIELNEEILSKVKQNLADIRILSVSKTQDTTEVPYYLKNQRLAFKKEGVNFSIINKSEKNGEFFFTFKLKNKKVINKILLDFIQDNFNWQIILEASQNQKEWKTILKGYRILAINNSQTKYQFTKLLFPKSEYEYYRIRFKSKEKPLLKSVSLEKETKNIESLIEFKNKIAIKENKETKTSIYTISLDSRLPISHINFDFSDDIDFQRPIFIKYVTDSFNTENGWKYNYRTLTRTYVSSLEKNIFEFDVFFTNKIIITIHNNDNQELSLKNIETKSVKFELVSRFLKNKNTHYIVYGDNQKRKPIYDIVNFKDKVPKDISTLKIGNQIVLNQKKDQSNSIFNNKIWLWILLSIIIALLAYSTLSMLKTKKFDKEETL